MKTLIIYATKYGTTEKCALKLEEKIVDSKAINVNEIDINDFLKADRIILGSSVYAGQIRKELKKFVTKNENRLLKKKLSIFLCGMQKGIEQEKAINLNFSEEMKQHANVINYVGGAYQLEKCNFLERLAVKVIAKATESKEEIDYDKLYELV
ncbi:flavodoxin domain-containing protein [Mycoplasmatota bacterium zrk1]